MFSNAVRQKERTGKYGTSRDQYLQALLATLILAVLFFSLVSSIIVA